MRGLSAFAFAFALLACAGGSPRVRTVAPEPAALASEAELLASKDAALFGYVLADGRVRTYAGSGFTWAPESACYEATAWLEGRPATSDDHLRIRLCPSEGGRYAVAVTAAVGGTRHVLDDVQAKIGLALDDERSVVVVTFGMLIANEESVPMGGPGRTMGYVGSADVTRFAGRLAATIRMKSTR